MSESNAQAPNRAPSDMKIPQKVTFIEVDEPKTTKDGKPYVSGMLELTKNGKTIRQPFTAFDEETKNGKRLTPASDIVAKFKAGDVGYVKGTFTNDQKRDKSGNLVESKNDKGYAYRRLIVKFADSEAEHEAFRAKMKEGKEKSAEAR